MHKKNFIPRIILRYPEFESHYKINSSLGFKKVYNFNDIEGVDWFLSFFNQIMQAKKDRKYLPIYRMGDGEYNFLLGRHIYEIVPFYRLSIKQILIKIKLLFKKKKGHSSGAAGDKKESYTKEQLNLLNSKYISDLKFISNNGILAIALDTGKFYGLFMPYVKHFFDNNNIILNEKNYFHVYHVYSLFGSSFRTKLLQNSKVLIITSLDKQKEIKIKSALLSDNIQRVDFYPISATKSMLEIIDLDKIDKDLDIVLVAAGIGSSNILRQLEPLSIPCIDVGFSLVNLIDSNRGYDRPYMINDKYFDLEKIRFISERQKSKVRKSKVLI